MGKKQHPKLIKNFLLSLMILTGTIYLFGQNSETSSIVRENPEEYEILLDNPVPLSEDDLVENSLYVTYKAINDYRVENGFNELIWSDELADCAAVRAEECSRVWSHTRPNGEAWYTVNPQIMFGENLARGFSADTVIQGWKDSPTHNENLLYPDFKYIGLAEYNGRIACEFCYQGYGFGHIPFFYFLLIFLKKFYIIYIVNKGRNKKYENY